MATKIMRSLLVCLISLGLCLSQAQSAYAQNQSRTGAGPSVRSQVAKILLSSLGGAVLGISTLSFYDRPQDHLSNVAVGGTLGAVLGSIYVTKESLDYDSVASLDEGGNFQLLLEPKNKKYLLAWHFSF